MSDHKNTILAIVLSLIVVVGWQYFIGYPQMEKQRQQALLKQQEQAQPSRRGAAGAAQPGARPAPPGARAAGAGAPAHRRAAADRIARGGDRRVAAHRHRHADGCAAASTSRAAASTICRSSNIARPSIPTRRRSCCSRRRARRRRFTPSSAGWPPPAPAQQVPGPDTVWKQDGSGALGIDHPVTLTYDNGEGLIFRRTIAVDDHYLFTLKDEVQNKSGSPVTLFPYALISRHGTPKVQGYYILHEGLIGVMGDQGLQEETYKKIDDKKNESWDVTNAWLGFTDKYWAAALLPDTDAKVHARFSAGRSRRRARPTRPIICCEPQTIAPGATGSADARLFAGAKEVSVVGINFPLGARRLQPGAPSQPFRSADRLGLVLFHHQADVPRHRLLLPSGRQFRHRHPDRHRAGQAPVLPARQQVLRLDGEDEGGAAADGDDQGALRRRQDEAAAGDDGAVQEGADQSGRRLPADRDPDPGVLLALQGAVHHHRDAARAVLRLDPRSVGARPDQHLHPVRPDPVRSDRAAGVRRASCISASGRRSWA